MEAQDITPPPRASQVALPMHRRNPLDWLLAALAIVKLAPPLVPAIHFRGGSGVVWGKVQVPDDDGSSPVTTHRRQA